MHLLLASQRLDEGRLRGLESHLSYRVCLKTLSANESRLVLGTTDAYELPSAPGAAYLREGTDGLIRFQTAYVSGPYNAKIRCPAGPPDLPDSGKNPTLAQLFTAVATGPVTLTDRAGLDVADRPTVLQTVVDRLSGHGPRAHEVWLPPLGPAPALDTVLHDAESTGKPMPALTVPIGVVDRPFEQKRTPLIVDLSGAAGECRCCRSTSVGEIDSFAYADRCAGRHSRSEFGAVLLPRLRRRGAVIVARMAARRFGCRPSRTAAGSRMVTRLEAIIRSRETIFRDHGIQSMAQYRLLKAEARSSLRPLW